MTPRKRLEELAEESRLAYIRALEYALERAHSLADAPYNEKWFDWIKKTYENGTGRAAWPACDIQDAEMNEEVADSGLDCDGYWTDVVDSHIIGVLVPMRVPVRRNVQQMCEVCEGMKYHCDYEMGWVWEADEPEPADDYVCPDEHCESNWGAMGGEDVE